MAEKFRVSKLLASYAASLVAAIVLWLIPYARGVTFHFAGVFITTGVFSVAVMAFVDVLIFLIA